MRLSASDVERLSEGLRDLYAHRSLETLPARIVRLLREAIPCDSAAFNYIDFRRREARVIHDHGAEADRYIPVLGELVRTHPLVNHLRTHGRAGAARMSDVIARRKLRSTAIYAEFFQPLGIERQLGLQIECRGYALNAVGLQRSGSDFSQRDVATLNFLHIHLAQAYKNAVDLDRLRHLGSAPEPAWGDRELSAIWLQRADRVDRMSSQAAAWLRRYFGRTAAGKSRRLPPRLADWVRAQVAAHQARERRPEVFPERSWPGPGGRLLVRWVPGTASSAGCLILSEQRNRHDPDELRGLELTPRETEVLHWLAEGKTNEVIGRILSVSTRTVEKHVEHILEKLRVETRVAAALKARELRARVV